MAANEAIEIARKLKASDTWLIEECRELCKLAGMVDAWDNADGEEFETILFAAADKLGVEII